MSGEISTADSKIQEGLDALLLPQKMTDADSGIEEWTPWQKIKAEPLTDTYLSENRLACL